MNVTIPNTGGGQQQPTSITPTPNTTILRDANGRSQVAVPAVAADIARLDTVTAHTSLTNNPHAVTTQQIGAVKVTGDVMSGNLTAPRFFFGQNNTIGLPHNTDANSITVSGDYVCSMFTNRPSEIHGWAYLNHIQHVTGTLYSVQTIYDFYEPNNVFFRRSIDSGGVRTWSPWQRMWHSGNQSILFTNPSFTGNVGINTAVPTAPLDIEGNTVRVRTARTPTSTTAPGNVGDICWDANFVYVCIATNTWRRSALTAW